MSFETIITTELNNAFNTIDLNENRAIKEINKADNLRKKCLKDITNVELQYYLIEQVYKMAVEFKNENLTILYKKMLGESDIKNKKIKIKELLKNKEFLLYLISLIFPTVILLTIFYLNLN